MVNQVEDALKNVGDKIDANQKAGVESYIVREPQGGHGMGMYSEENLKKMVDFLNAQRAKTAKK